MYFYRMIKPSATRLYWIGPCDILVPCNVKSVSWFDCNSITRDGTVTEMAELDDDDNLVPPLSDEEYLAEYAHLSKDGHYHWKFPSKDEFVYDGNDETDYYWIGPYGMLVLSTVSSVKAENGVDTHHSDGTITLNEKSNREAYLKAYATSDDDKIWYYILEEDEEVVQCNKKRRLDSS